MKRIIGLAIIAALLVVIPASHVFAVKQGTKLCHFDNSSDGIGHVDFVSNRGNAVTRHKAKHGDCNCTLPVGADCTCITSSTCEAA